MKGGQKYWRAVVGLDNHGLKTILGIVIPVEWDKDGSVITIDIMCRDESSYWVENTGPARELLRFLQQEVMVTGKINKLKNGKRSIQVIDYQLPNPLSVPKA